MVHLIIDQPMEKVLRHITQALEKDFQFTTAQVAEEDDSQSIFIISQERPHVLPQTETIKKPQQPAMRPPYPVRITQREREVLQLIEQGYTTREISDKLFRSKHTIDTHRKNLLGKLEAKNAVELINNARAWAIL